MPQRRWPVCASCPAIALPGFPAVTADDRGWGYVSRGRDLGPAQVLRRHAAAVRQTPDAWVRVVDAAARSSPWRHLTPRRGYSTPQ